MAGVAGCAVWGTFGLCAAACFELVVVVWASAVVALWVVACGLWGLGCRVLGFACGLFFCVILEYVE